MLLIRYITYFFSVALVTFLLTRLEVSFPGALHIQEVGNSQSSLGGSDYSPVKFIQWLILIVCGALLGWTARQCPAQRAIAMPFAGVALIFLVRELDYFLDRHVANNFWLVVAAIVAALTIVYGYRNSRRFRIAWYRVWPSPGLTLYFAGLIVIVAFTTFVGHEPFWQALLGEHFQRVVMLAFKDLTELVGYALWLIGTIEYSYQSHAIAKQEPQTVVAKRRAGRHPKSEGRF